MASKATDETKSAAQLLQFGKERTEAMIHVQKEDAYQEASKAWAGRVQSELKFWSELAGKLAASRSVPKEWKPAAKASRIGWRWPRTTADVCSKTVRNGRLHHRLTG